MIYVTGDTHADFSRFTTNAFPEQKDMTKDDFVIICGDFGGVWNNQDMELYWRKWLSKKSFTTLFVDGNHENFDSLNKDFDVVDFHGGKAHKITDSIYHLMRGEVYEICDKKIFAFGGASSHDIRDGIIDPSKFSSRDMFKQEVYNWTKEYKQFRIKGMSWWEQEMPSDEEMMNGINNLEKHNYDIDYVFTHSLPSTALTVMSRGTYKTDKLTNYLSELIDNGLRFTEWFCGHYHVNAPVHVGDGNKYTIMYHRINRIV